MGINVYLPLYFTPVNWINMAIMQEAPERKHTLSSKVDKAIEITVNLGYVEREFLL